MKIIRRPYIILLIVKFYIILLWSSFALIPVFAVTDNNIFLLLLIIPMFGIFASISGLLVQFCNTRIVIDRGYLDLTHYYEIPINFRFKIRVEDIVSVNYETLITSPIELFGGRIYDWDYLKSRLEKEESGSKRRIFGSLEVYCCVTDVYNVVHIFPTIPAPFYMLNEELVKLNPSITIHLNGLLKKMDKYFNENQQNRKSKKKTNTIN